MPDAVSVELSSEPGSYNGGSGDFVTVNLLELTGDSLDPRAARGDTCGANRIRRRRAAVIAASAAGGLSRPARAISSLCRSHRALRWKEGKLKKDGFESSAEAICAQSSSTLSCHRLPGTRCRASRRAQRSTLSARSARQGSSRVAECAASLLTEFLGIRFEKLNCWRSHCSERAGSVSSFAQQPCSLRSGASADWGRSKPQSHQLAHARSDPRHSCQVTHCAARSSDRSSHSGKCPPAYRERTGTEARCWRDSSRRFWAKLGNRKLTGGLRRHLRGPIFSRSFRSCQARRSSTDSESWENSQREARGSRGGSRKQGAQGLERPRRRSKVLAQTRRCLSIAALWQLPQPQVVHRHDRCGPGRGKVWKPAASKCSASPHQRCSGIGIPRFVPRNAVGMAHLGHSRPRRAEPCSLGPAEQIAPTTKTGRLGCSAQEYGCLRSDWVRRNRAQYRPHQERDPVRARPTKCQGRQRKRGQEGRVRRGMIRPGPDPPGHPPGPRLPDFSNSPLLGGEGGGRGESSSLVSKNRGKGHGSLAFCISVP